MLKQTIYLLAGLLLVGFSSCADEDFDPVLRIGDTATINEPADNASFVITEENLPATMATFSWSAADFGVPTEVTYFLQADLAGNNFAEPFRLAPGGLSRSIEVTNNTINNFLINREIEAGTPTEIEVRVRSLVGNDVDGNQTFSTPITLVVTPFAAEIEYPRVWVPGAYQMWTPAVAPNLYSVDDNGVYTGFINFGDTGSDFKVTNAPSWDEIAYGKGDEDGMLSTSGGDLTSAGSGLHRIIVNINDLTIDQTPISWGIIGDGTPTGWGSDTDLSFDAENNTLSVTTDLTAGTNGDGNPLAFKFRANDAWDIDFGDNDADGTLDYGGSNISVPETGNYTVTLNLFQAIPTYTIVKN